MKYPIGIQQFEKIRKGGFVYVDKTAQVYQLATQGCYYFLSRPRRFGKSLLISTMEAYFLGVETEWKRYPVLHLDLNARNYENEDSLRAELNKHLVSWEETYGLSALSTLAPEERFFNVIRHACEQTGEQVVILVDEYDKPLLSTIGNKPLHDAYRNTLKGFFSVLKSQAIHTFRLPHWREPVQPRQHLQRPEQPARHLDDSGLCRHLRHIGERTARLL